MIGKLHRSGGSFRGAIAYCLDEPRDRELRPDAPSGEPSRVAWTETVNLATDDARVAARQMAATVTAARASLRSLGLEDHQAVLVAHRDGTTPHVHVVANRVSIEDGRAAPLSQSRLQLSRWAEAYERQQGHIRCPRRVAHNQDRRLVGPMYDPARGGPVYDVDTTGDARYRRTQCGRIARVPIADGRSALEMAGVAVRRCTPARRTSGIGSTGTVDRCAAGSSGGARPSDPGANSAA